MASMRRARGARHLFLGLVLLCDLEGRAVRRERLGELPEAFVAGPDAVTNGRRVAHDLDAPVLLEGGVVALRILVPEGLGEQVARGRSSAELPWARAIPGAVTARDTKSANTKDVRKEGAPIGRLDSQNARTSALAPEPGGPRPGSLATFLPFRFVLGTGVGALGAAIGGSLDAAGSTTAGSGSPSIFGSLAGATRAGASTAALGAAERSGEAELVAWALGSLVPEAYR